MFVYRKNMVMYESEYICVLSQKLIEQQNIDEKTLEAIKQMHIFKYLIFKEVAKLDVKTNLPKIKALYDVYKMIEFELQRLWGFDKDEAFHKFWEFPLCRCPELDNHDRWPSGVYIYSNDCPIHGNFTKTEEE